MKKEQITIIGRGWLGTPLESALKAKSFEVYCTTRPGFDVTRDILIEPLSISDIFIYTITPLPLISIKAFFESIPTHKRIIFISSTSVFGKNQGPVDEISELLPESDNGKILKETEEYLRSRFKNATILRPGGLYGSDRHPIKSLQGKTELKTGDETLHLVHQSDCIEAMINVIEKKCWGETFNLVSDLKIKKKIYYPEMAKKLNLTLPQYANSLLTNATIISNDKSKKILSLQYKNPNDLN